jgi:peptide deformylase
MKIVTVPNYILNQKAKPVLQIDKKIHQLIKEMTTVLNEQINPPGVGLAAPQVGIPLQLFIIKPTKKAKIEAFVNPRIVKYESVEKPARLDNKTSKVLDNHPKTSEVNGGDTTSQVNNIKKTKNTPLEGCLSIRKIWGYVKRANKVLLEYQTITDEKKTEWFSGFKAIIIQHEIDHVNGILFTQRALEQGKQLYEEKEGKLIKLKT